MDIASTAASAVAARQTQARQNVTTAAMRRESEQAATLTAELEKAAHAGRDEGTTPTRGQNVNLKV